MSIKKQFLKSKPQCKVTFKFDTVKDYEVESVKVVGSFNNWDLDAEPMKLLKSGEFTQTISLEQGNDVEFRYLVNNSVWMNDKQADGFTENGIQAGENNCVLHL